MKILTTTLLLLLSLSCFAQVERSNDLFKTLRTKDSLLFNVGFNTCDIQQFEDLVSNDFEFYHDQAGVTSSKAAFITSIKDGLCKLSYKPRRELVAGSLEVYPLKKNEVLYGAVQMGRHRFYALEAGKPAQLTSVARFTHVWRLENNRWQLSRGVSFDHQDQDRPGARDTINESRLFIDQKETEKWLVENGIPALGLGYIKAGSMQFARVYGELSKGKPAPDNTLFNVASLTKPLTAWVALRLVSAGKWRLDEPICHYWTDPDLANDPRAKALTTRHILSHQTGFPNWRPAEPPGKLAFAFAPGAKYQYSGEGFEYLRRALERKFHKPLDQLAAELVFKPLEMKDTRFFWDAGMDEARFAKWHDPQGNVYDTPKNTTASGADDLLTTVEDYGRFLLAVMRGSGVSRRVFKEMVSPQVKTQDNKYFGLGWEIYSLPEGKYALAHGGVDKGVRTQVFVLPQSKEALLIFTNVDDGYKVYERLVTTYLGENGKRIVAIELRK